MPSKGSKKTERSNDRFPAGRVVRITGANLAVVGMTSRLGYVTQSKGKQATVRVVGGGLIDVTKDQLETVE